jgi:hypothetical protein
MANVNKQAPRLTRTPQWRPRHLRNGSKAHPKNHILDTVHDTARDLFAGGFIDKRRISEYDALCLAPVPEYSSKKIRALQVLA